MKHTLTDRLLKRELGGTSRYSAIKGIYGDKQWVEDLDIVNELGGHTGCVNALSWSKSGQLLASGSDDKYLNIHRYQPESSTAPFSLTHSVSTGHSANIFSVKFMPHSDDRTVVTAAGDSEVRVFDIEYSGRSAENSSSTSSAAAAAGRSRQMNSMFNGVSYLNQGDTNGRVYRSHSDRVKRIVTESSPHLFLTCSEDGEVRQWDLRQPSSAYPPGRGGRGFRAWRAGGGDETGDVPPPLISYKRYGLDLNTISCSPSQPHYIALGGAHLYCFLHDRRMVGRDLSLERGSPGGRAPSAGTTDDEQMGTATKCVRRFAPGKQSRRSGPGPSHHITACKISDANPNEMIVSWSGDDIYSFDLVQSPDAREAEAKESTERAARSKGRAREQRERKRKRNQRPSQSSAAGEKPLRQRQKEDPALRVRYGNGETENIPLSNGRGGLSSMTEEAREAVMTPQQRASNRIAKGLVRIRKSMFSLEENSSSSSGVRESDITPHTPSFTSVLGFTASYLTQMDDIMRSWRYPVDPEQDEVTLHQTLRRNRQSARRFVQASGTLARVLGGKLRTAGSGPSPMLSQFKEISPAPNEAKLDQTSHFSYDFLKAILLWLESGLEGLLQGFKRPANVPKTSTRFPIPEEAGREAIDEILIPYLLRLASDRSILNVDANRFETEEARTIFSSEKAAVISFGNAIKIPLEDLERAIMPANTSEDSQGRRPENIRAMDRKAATRYWAFKVGRAVLMKAGEKVNYSFVNRAFGGLEMSVVSDLEEENESDSSADEEVVESFTLVHGSGDNDTSSVEDCMTIDSEGSTSTGDQLGSSRETPASQGFQSTLTSSRREPLRERARSINADSDEDTATADEPSADALMAEIDIGDESDAELALREEVDHEDEDEDEDEAGDDQDTDVDDDDDDDTQMEDPESDSDDSLTQNFRRRTGLSSTRLREKSISNIPCSSHTGVYTGHCNVKTVKDVNYFGMDDQYVVSGCDSGHFFIWDKKTSQLVNILEGDGEVVNVVQGMWLSILF